MAGRTRRRELPKPSDSAGNKSLMEKVSSNIGNTLENTRRELRNLERELRDDHTGRAEFEDMLLRMKSQRDMLAARIQENKQFTKDFERDIGPFQDKYHAMVGEVDVLYGEAKGRHASGIQLLIREFDYHPSFKRWNDEFSSTPWKPK